MIGAVAIHSDGSLTTLGLRNFSRLVDHGLSLTE